MLTCHQYRRYRNWQGKIESNRHSDACDSSCPDCLRSYDNRFIHPYLDWRLALDLVDVATGGHLPLGRWLSRAEAITENFLAAFGTNTDYRHISSGGLHGVYARAARRATVFGHPLWRAQPQYFVEFQESAASQLLGNSNVDSIRFFDLATLQRYPSRVFAWLNPHLSG